MSFGVDAGFVLANGWLVANFLGIFVLLSIYVMTHVVAALMSFRMISLVPHHLPKLIGFSATNRVDTDQFSSDAALVGVGGALNKVNNSVQPNAGRLSGHNPNSQVGYNTKLLPNHSGEGSSNGGSRTTGNMDSTLHATTDEGHHNPREQET
jgi:hypothetical protein